MRKLLVGACLALFVMAPAALQAQHIGVGGQLSYADDAEVGIGVRGSLGLPKVPVEFIGSFDYFFPGNSINYWEINANAVYVFSIPSAPTISPYAGGGLNIGHFSIDEEFLGNQVSISDTEAGFNLLGGAQFNVGPVTPFGELRIELGGGEQFVLSGGAMFSVGPGF